MAEYSERAPQRAPLRAGTLVRYTGAALSLGLIIGVCVWGYNLVMRNVNGIPVVQAMEGPMRIAPPDPGGEIADHEGLSVNAVVALGSATAPEEAEMLVLAPQAVEPTIEDLSVQPDAEQDEMLATAQASAADSEEVPIVGQAAPPVVANLNLPTTPAVAQEPEAATPDAPVSDADILALADQIAGNAVALAPLAEGETAPAALSVNGVSAEVIADIVPASVPGVAVSLRPQLRPAAVASVAATQVPAAEPAPDAAPVAETLVSSATIAAGTNLVQLGAYDSAEIAASEWTRLNARFDDYMSGKEHLIQEATRNGRTFFRLRALGFTDQSDARRFCAALIAENADCVPVVVR